MTTDFPKTLEEFVSDVTLDSINPLFGLAAANVRLTRALGKAVRIQTEVVRTIADQIEAVGNLNVEIGSYSQGKADTNSVKDFGKNNEDAFRMMELCLAYGVEKKTLEDMYAKYEKGERVVINDKTIDLIQSALGARTEQLNSTSSKQTLTLQTLSSRYNQSSEQASNGLQRDYQTKSTIINNSRGIS